jgi:glycosyltransferase involved in cell wall biosynthesis
VFVATYRRHAFLPRALQSLRAQTFADWICELHNDDPNDKFPGDLVQRLQDPRIEVHNHSRHLGPAGTFNLFYNPTKEPFYSLLEDDNWWEPEFLETMFREMKSRPEVTLAWCNQKIWEETPDGSWRDTGKFMNPPEQGAPRYISFGTTRQAMMAVHANGAMLLRSRPDGIYKTPVDFPFLGMEAFRERMIPHPVLYVPQPLGIWSRTLQSARSRDRADWDIVHTILAATFYKNADCSNAQLAALLADARGTRPPTTRPLILAALMEPCCRKLLRHSRLTDWVLLLRGIVWRPKVFWRVISSLWQHREWWQLLDQNTAARFCELRSAHTEFGAPSHT